MGTWQLHSDDDDICMCKPALVDIEFLIMMANEEFKIIDAFILPKLYEVSFPTKYSLMKQIEDSRNNINTEVFQLHMHNPRRKAEELAFMIKQLQLVKNQIIDCLYGLDYCDSYDDLDD